MDQSAVSAITNGKKIKICNEGASLISSIPVSQRRTEGRRPIGPGFARFTHKWNTQIPIFHEEIDIQGNDVCLLRVTMEAFSMIRCDRKSVKKIKPYVDIFILTIHHICRIVA
jgi:hypothetical protein